MRYKEIVNGDRFGKWLVLELDSINRASKFYKCRCDCGNECIVRDGDLKRGKSKKCIKCNIADLSQKFKSTIIDLTNQKIGNWSVIRRVENNKYRKTLWECICDCGNVCIVQGQNLLNGKSTKCSKCAKENSKGHSRKNKAIKKADIKIGDRFEKWTIINIFKTEKGKLKRWLCKCECGTIKDVTQHNLVYGESTRCRQCGYRDAGQKCFNDILNQKFGCLKVTKKTQKRSSNGVIYWECMCDCGKIVERQYRDLVKGKVKNCGKCNECNEITGRIFSKIYNSAKGRNIEFNLEITELWDLYIKQDKKCFFTGLPIHFGDSYSNEMTCSLDRIYSDKGYVINNVVWVHKIVNIIKWSLDPNDFIAICKLIADYNKENNHQLDINKLNDYFTNRNKKK